MLDKIKDKLHQSIEELCATAVVDEMAGDAEGHRRKLGKIAEIAKILDIKTEITEVTINLKD